MDPAWSGQVLRFSRGSDLTLFDPGTDQPPLVDVLSWSTNTQLDNDHISQRSSFKCVFIGMVKLIEL